MAEHLLVTLDGPAGVGKTTLAKRLAAELGVAYLDTGAMFRAVGWYLGESARDLSDEQLENGLSDLEFSLRGTGSDSEIMVGGKALGSEIRSEEVGMLASTLATRKPVRAFLKATQQEIGKSVSLVAEGRDMGTVVFPDAQYKFFLDASAEARAMRRYRQLTATGEKADLQEITLKLKIRDAQDRNRPIAPLKAADDAMVVDTTCLNVEGVFKAIMAAMGAKDKKSGKRG